MFMFKDLLHLFLSLKIDIFLIGYILIIVSPPPTPSSSHLLPFLSTPIFFLSRKELASES